MSVIFGDHRRTAILSTLLFILGVARGWADVNFFLEPKLQKGLGGTSYDLSAPQGGGVTDMSRLEFPQFSLEAGAVLGLSIGHDGNREWLFEAGIAHSTFPISGTMNDHDWEQYLGYPRIPFSYTESQNSTVSWHASFEAAWTLATAKPWSIALYGTYRFQSISQVEDTATGWQYVWNSTANAYDLYLVSIPTSDVLEYTLSSHQLGLGILADLDGFPGFLLELRAAYTPVYVSDQDDHKLRTKLLTASGWGNGLYADIRASLQLGQIADGVTTYLALEGELIYYVVSTIQTQYWYGNADASNGAPQGTLITGIGHIVTSEQYQIGLGMGFKF